MTATPAKAVQNEIGEWFTDKSSTSWLDETGEIGHPTFQMNSIPFDFRFITQNFDIFRIDATLSYDNNSFRYETRYLA